MISAELPVENDLIEELPSSDDASFATSVSLLERARNEDADAWGRLVELYAPLVYHWCRTWGLNPSAAEDVGQDVFLSVATGLSRFRKDRPGDTFRGWLRVITQRRVVDHLRRVGAEPKAFGGEGIGSLDNAQINDARLGESNWESRFLFERAVGLIRARFSDRDWQAFYRTAVIGEPSRAVASELMMSINSVYLARSRIAHFVREEFAGIIDE